MIKFNELYISPDSKKMTIDVSITELEEFKDVYVHRIYIHNQHTFKDGKDFDPSDHPVYMFDVEEYRKKVYIEDEHHHYLYEPLATPEEKVYAPLNENGDTKSVRIELTDEVLNLRDDMFFVYATVKGEETVVTEEMLPPDFIEEDPTLYEGKSPEEVEKLKRFIYWERERRKKIRAMFLYDDLYKHKNRVFSVVCNMYNIFHHFMHVFRHYEHNKELFIDHYLAYKAFEMSVRNGYFSRAIDMWNKFFGEVLHDCKIYHPDHHHHDCHKHHHHHHHHWHHKYRMVQPNMPAGFFHVGFPMEQFIYMMNDWRKHHEHHHLDHFMHGHHHMNPHHLEYNEVNHPYIHHHHEGFRGIH